MSALSDFCNEIRDWIDDTDPTDAMITTWIRDAEERLNNELRTNEQIVRTYATFDDDCSTLPDDWLEFLYVRYKGGRPFDFITNHDYWQLKTERAYGTSFEPNTSGEVYPSIGKALYTIIGRTLFVWPPINPDALTQIETAYYRKVQPLGPLQDPLQARYPAIYRYCTLAAGAPYLVEDERLSTFASLATAGIQKANDAAKMGRHSGSPIAPRIRGFG